MTSRSSRGPDSHSPSSSTEFESGASEFVDAEQRTVRFVPYRPNWFDSLVEMYETFAASQRAQGLPPVTKPAIETWLDEVLGGTSVLAVHDDAVVGHVLFVADGNGAHELGVFVHRDYQGAGVGTNLVRAGFEHARRAGVSTVWLSVERSNHAARAVYDKLGFDEDVTKHRSVRLSREL